MTVCYQGAHFTRVFSLTETDEVTPVDISGWTFEAQLREQVDDDEALVTLTSGDGGFTIVDGPGGRLKIIITAAQSVDLPVGRLAFDVLRTDISPGPVWIFGGRIPVKQPVTRDE